MQINKIKEINYKTLKIKIPSYMNKKIWVKSCRLPENITNPAPLTVDAGKII